MHEQTVLLVDPSGPDGTILAERIASDGEFDVSVRVLEDLGEIYEVLTNSTVHCVVLPATVGDRDGEDVVRGVRGLFPDLPIVVSGPLERDNSKELDATVVESESPTGESVARAVARALDGGVDTDAARPPSRMETMLLSMLGQFPVHIYAKDEAARHVITSSMNQSATDLVGLTDLEYTDLPEEHRRAAYRDDLSVLEGDGKRVEIEEYTDFIDSYTLTTKVPWYDADDDVIGLVGLTRDITERKKREQASRRQHELLVKVALVAAHELRNELQVAAGRLELLEDDDVHVEDPTDHIGTIAESQRRLVDIVDKVVGLASAERPTRTEQELWLSTMAREVWDTQDTGEAELRIVEDLHFVADRESTTLFLQILFRNAIQHAGSAVSVTVGATGDGFFVADDGDGIDAAPPERVFDAGYTTDPDSTGFGLYVARSIAEEHGWRLELGESADGGARFDVVGPALEDEQVTQDDQRTTSDEFPPAQDDSTAADGDGSSFTEDESD